MSGPETTLVTRDGRTPPKSPSRVAQLVLALECDRPLTAPQRYSLAEVETVHLGRGAELACERSGDALHVRVPDGRMSSTHAVLKRSFGRWVVEDCGSKNGTLLNGLPEPRAVLDDGDVLELGHTFLVFREGPPDDPGDEADVARAAAVGLVTLHSQLRREHARLSRVASTNAPVLVRGETGAGKELVARAVHALSGRAGAFIAVNCGALPEGLIEAELFGARKGAYSGAGEDRLGLMRAADGGTLFLDEIGDLRPVSQAALLRALQEREVLPVGATRPVPVDFRVVAATHQDLDALIARGSFRADLYGRLAGFCFDLPPLRERREDLGAIVAALLQRVAGERAPSLILARDAARALFVHTWPMNVRELEQALRAGVGMARGVVLEPEHLPEAVRAAAVAPAEPPAALTPEDEAQRQALVAALQEHQGNISAVARALGKGRVQIQRWLKRYAIDPERYR